MSRIRSWWNSLEKYSDNAFDFQLFPSMQLGDEQETVRALQLGTLQMSMLATNNYAPFAPSCGWVNMPYLFDTLDEFRALLDAMWEQNNEWAVKEGGCRILSILDIGYRQLTTSAKHPVRKLADAKGIKIRTPQNALMVSTFKALGLEPTAVSFSETFNALQQGVVDGQEGCFNNVVTLKFYEAQKYVDPDQLLRAQRQHHRQRTLAPEPAREGAQRPDSAPARKLWNMSAPRSRVCLRPTTS